MSVGTRTVDIRRRRLPHWTVDQGTYFVTFRLQDAMSPELARRIAERRRHHALADRFLDRGHGRCWLRDPRVARCLDRELRSFAAGLCHAWVIMPNHVHVAIRLAPGALLPAVLKHWKGRTARQANRILGRSGTFWQEESYDSLLHDQHDLDRVLHYIEHNPIRAKLSNWPWVAIESTAFRLRAED